MQLEGNVKTLILGGTGLISTAIAQQLLARGEDVTLYNRGQRQGFYPNQAKTILGDRKQYAGFEAQMAQNDAFDCVIDMICYLPEEAESAVRAFRGRTAQYVLCSTVDVYTKPARRYPITPDAERQPRPSFPYAWNKARCEEILEQAHARGDFALTIIRPAHTYGEGGRLIHSLGFETYFLDRIRRGLPIIAHGDGSSLWTACHRDDVAGAFVGAVGNARAFGRAYTASGDEWMTWNQYYQGIAEAMGAPALKLVHIPTDLLGRVLPQRALWCVENFSFNNVFDNSASKSDLGFRQTIPWVQGVRGTVEFLDQAGRIEPSEAYPFYDRLISAWEQCGAAMADSLAGLDA